MYTELFSKKLAKARKDAGYTQLQTSELLGIPRSTIANWETGRTQPDIESIGIMADFYEVSVDWLMGTKGQNFSKLPIVHTRDPKDVPQILSTLTPSTKTPQPSR